ncbi:melanization protease 1-like [Culex pipiens pallens]|uniref:melanization protease 1-like n=1 Tax=Culex pipiens pallens TaxID=42434 RepID=UPI001953AA69|nr:melanization protease 1-like [Culex pipiens pallens]
MANLLLKLPILCVLLGLNTISSQETSPCLTAGAKPGRCVDIDLCPFLRDLAQAAVLSKQEQLLLKKRICGERKVCCEEPSSVTSEPPIAPASMTRKPIVTSPPTRTPTPTPGRKMALPGTSICGLDTVGEKIFAGERTELDQFPWAVALEYRTEDPPAVKCGGSLINTRYVITAAHCVKHVQKEDIIARLGEWNLEANPDCDDYNNCNPEVIYAEIAAIKVHPQYRQRQNDIALLKLKKALNKDYYVHIRPICLPESADLMQNLFIHQNVSVVGWGGTEIEPRSQFKMYTSLVTISVNECQAELQQTLTKPKLYANHICAKSATGFARDACGGDSGGPMMASVQGSWYLIGVVGFGPPCGKTLLPGVYARVTSYMDWIEDNLVD